MLGLAMKAGKVSSGEFATEQAVKSGSAYLVIGGNGVGQYTEEISQYVCIL